MQSNKKMLNIVRIGSYMTYSSLKELGNCILNSFRGTIKEFKLAHHNTPVVEELDALLLTTVLHDEFGGHTLGITDADLKTDEKEEFYKTIIGGKNSTNDVAVVSTRRLIPERLQTEKDYELFLARTLKVAIHEIGHNFGLTDHYSYKLAPDNQLCPMSKGEPNKFGYYGYIKGIIDGRGIQFCDECADFLKKLYGYKTSFQSFLFDGLRSQLAQI